MLDHKMQQLNLLQDGLSCAAAILFAIEAGDLFKALPADPQDHDQHNHGCVMLGMLGDRLRSVQAQVDTFDKSPNTNVGG